MLLLSEEGNGAVANGNQRRRAKWTGRNCANCNIVFCTANCAPEKRFCSSECMLSFCVRDCPDDDCVDEELQKLSGLACSFELVAGRGEKPVARPQRVL